MVYYSTMETLANKFNLQNLLKEMLEERASLPYLGDILPLKRQEYYTATARLLFGALGCMNPFKLDPTKELEAYKEIIAKVDHADW